jgi:dolichol-phosphate mannosyltransferase
MPIELKEKPALFVVMPVFNEEKAIAFVLDEWIPVFDKTAQHYKLYCIDDGSTDNSLSILKEYAKKFEQIEVISRENKGHGASCIQGYKEALNRKIPYVFQLDSDGQCDPLNFSNLWSMRLQYDVVYGKRVKRLDGWKRLLITKVLRILLLLFFQVNCPDANVPYRLMKTELLDTVLSKLHGEVFLANIAIAILIKKSNATHAYLPIVFRDRYGGEPSVRLEKFAGKAFELYKQLKKVGI